MKIETRIEGLDNVLSLLKSLPPELASKNGGPVRKAVLKGAVILRNQARLNVTAVTNTPGKTGKSYGTGFTAKNVILKRRPIRGGEKGERFIVTVKPNEHPKKTIKIYARKSKRKGSTAMTQVQMVRANDLAFMLEYGTAKQPPEPWLRPAFESRKQDALRAMIDTLNKAINDILRKRAK